MGIIFVTLQAFAISYREGIAKGKQYGGFLALLAAMRILIFPKHMAQYNSLKILPKLSNKTRMHDPLYFLVHNYYVSRRFTLRQRVRAAMQHHAHELKYYSNEYARHVYQLEGIRLWECCAENCSFAITLIATDDNLHEGELSVILSVNNSRLCRMSFCYLDADIFGHASSTTMLISRNQTDSTSARVLFDHHFKQNSPQLFCLAAVCGIAMINNFKTILAVKHDDQIAYDVIYDRGFRNSYTMLWEKFGAVELDGPVFRLNVPMEVPPLDLVSRIHRRRARSRREYWDRIMQDAQSSMQVHRIASTPHGDL